MSKLHNEPPSPGATAIAIACVVLLGTGAAAGERNAAQVAEGKTLRVLFLGNSFTQEHKMPLIVKLMAEAGNPGLDFRFISFGGSGARVQNHWEGTGVYFLRVATMTADEERAAHKSLEDALAKDPSDRRARSVMGAHKGFLSLPPPRKWDFVALQSYHPDDEGGEECLYVQYAEKFAKLCKAQGGRIVLFETATRMMNGRPLTEPWKPYEGMMPKQRVMAALANRIDAAVVPMSMVALVCHQQRPDFTLCYAKDPHPSRTMAYLTACTFYAALFERSPEKLPVDVGLPLPAPDATDKDGNPERILSPKDRADLQRIAWEGFSRFQKLRKTVKTDQ